MRFYRYQWHEKACLGVQVGNFLLNCEELFRKAGENPPEVVIRADLKTICAAPSAVIEFLASIIRSMPPIARPDDHLAVSRDSVKILAPIPDPGKIICIGLNYRDHCEEQNKPAPSWPMLFSKFSNTIAATGDDIRIPDNTEKLDFEGELGVVIGHGGRDIPRKSALAYVFGYMVVNDVSARDLQKSDGQWLRAKGQDGFAPTGPCIVTPHEIPDPQALTIQTRLNGQLMQDSTTANMIFPVAELIEFISHCITLSPGDIITTGTPSGVGIHRNPPVTLKSNDEVEITISQIGTLKNRFV
jgi:acylpyruvate hydrolase